MTPTRPAALAILAALLSGPGSAQDARDNPAVTAILDAALAECIADVRDMDPSAPVPELLVEPGAITWVDLDGEGERNDTVLDFNHVLCSLDYSLWHGSGGSILHLVVNGDRTASWSGGLWRITEFNGSPLMLIGRHGSACDGYGAQPCVQAVSVFEDGFSTVQFPQSQEESQADE